jgi:hypothetical protein
MTKHFATEPYAVNESNLSIAWAKAFLHIIDNAGTEITPLILSVHGFGNDRRAQEDVSLRHALDELLALKEMQNVETVAYTIFPQRLWDMAQGNRKKLFDTYRMVFPRYQAMNRKLNSRGLYFERLTNFSKESPCDGNQLEWILSQYNDKPTLRRSMFQATTFDPARDHIHLPRLGFPCLQQISFAPTSQGLVANAFYATQLVLMKGYGNYLGLIQLAAFMAHEMKMPLARLNVMVGIAKLDEIPKTDLAMSKLIKAARICVEKQSEEGKKMQTLPNPILEVKA